MQISTIGIDIGKNSFHFVGFDARGGIVIRRQCSRTQLVRALANVPPCLVGMEACCGAHHLGRILIAQGHDVRLIPPQYVKPFVKSQKNDLLDAEALHQALFHHFASAAAALLGGLEDHHGGPGETTGLGKIFRRAE